MSYLGAGSNEICDSLQDVTIKLKGSRAHIHVKAFFRQGGGKIMNKKVGLEYDPNFVGGDPFWFIDICHTEIGFEIIYRPEEIRVNDRIIEKLKKVL